MKTGVIILGNRSSKECLEVAERARDYLESNGRKNIRIAFHEGDPSSDAVMDEMNREGIDTFAILPLAISEGKTTVWSMPKKLGLPDNCGSWRMMNGKDVATRFATALGSNHALAEELVKREGEVRKNTALLLISFGSKNPDCSKTAEFYSGYLRDAGWDTETCYCRNGKTVSEAMRGIIDSGKKRVRIIPLFVAFDGPSALKARMEIESFGLETEFSRPISHLESFYLILDSKVPEGW